VPKSNRWSSTIGEMVLHPEFGIIWEEKHKGVAECQVCVCLSLSPVMAQIDPFFSKCL
jgi:hypothetical protein